MTGAGVGGWRYTEPIVSAVYIEKHPLRAPSIVQDIYGTSRAIPTFLFIRPDGPVVVLQGRGLFMITLAAWRFGFPGAMPLDGSYAVFDDMEAAGVPGLWFRDNSPKHYGYSVAIEFAEAVGRADHRIHRRGVRHAMAVHLGNELGADRRRG